MKSANTFAFRAATQDGRIDSGSLDATSVREAREALMARGLYVLDIMDRGPRGLSIASMYRCA